MEIEANALVRKSGAEGRILWADSSANFKRLCNREGVVRLVQKCKEANINVLVVDVKDITGRVLYNSQIAPQLTEIDGVEAKPGYDLLRTASEEARKAGLAVYASINVFSEGRKREGGPVFDHPDWESVVYSVEPWVKPCSGEPYPTAAINSRALPGRLALYYPGAELREKAADETVVIVDKETGEILDANPDSIEEGRIALVGSGAAGQWLSGLRAGEKVELLGKPRMIPSRLAVEMHNAIFVNPVNSQAREYELNIVKEIASNYDIDGIVFDRMRYSELNSDFSDTSRHAFETWLGKTVVNWPYDIITFPPIPSDKPRWGPLFNDWIEWRAKSIKDFFTEARAVIKAANPAMEASVYVGSWYWSYYTLGPNWASDKFRADAPWASPSFYKTGYAPLADWITTGCYYPVVTRDEAQAKGANASGTVQAAAEGSVGVIGNASFTYGGLYLLDYAKRPEEFLKAIDACRQATQGVMLFDLIYVEDYNWWELLKKAFPKPAPIPHKDVVLRTQLREAYERSY